MKNDLQKLITIFEAMADGVCIVNQEFTIEYMNSVMVDDFCEGTGEKCYQIFENRNDICSSCDAARVFKGETLHQEVYNKRADKFYDIVEIPLKNDDGTLSKLSIFRDITSKKRQEEKLKASEEQYRRLFELVGCGVFFSSKKGKFLDANLALMDMLGYSNREEFFEIDIIHDLYLVPQDRLRFIEIVEREGSVVDLDVEFKKRDGTPMPALLTGHVRYDHKGNVIGYEGIIVDQTQRKLMEREVRETNDFLNNIIHSSANAIMATDMKGTIILWNQSAEEILGYKTKDVVGKLNITKVYPEGMAKKVMAKIRKSGNDRKGILKFYPVVFIKLDGEIAEGNLSAAIVYDENHNEIATVGIFTDLKERLEMERRLKTTQEQLLQSEKLAAMGRLTSQIAHELNNPLYGIMNTLELMKTEISPDNKRRKLLEMALSEIVRLSELLRKMLTFSKPDQKEKQPVDIDTILDEMLLLHKKQFRENDILISMALPGGLGPVYASKNQLRQVFLNIFKNAGDAMPNGGTLTVVTSSQDEEIVIEISDTGAGIKKENINKIFDAFFTTKSSVKGVGLGLSVCYGFIIEHGGDIKVESEEGAGTKFIITLPVHNQIE
ncbi:MAG: PAS domain S-box protein [Desulfobulbaceae bacterium]|nr:PAS domain S-box protein [Desulfobulbaceae bacterium]